MKILCVCEEDVCLGPMAKAIMLEVIDDWRHIGQRLGTDANAPVPDEAIVESAGTHENAPNSPAHPDAVSYMASSGTDIGNHASRPLSEVGLNYFDLIVCTAQKEAEVVAKTRPRGKIILANPFVASPQGHGPEAYKACADLLGILAINVVSAIEWSAATAYSAEAVPA